MFNSVSKTSNTTTIATGQAHIPATGSIWVDERLTQTNIVTADSVGLLSNPSCGVSTINCESPVELDADDCQPILGTGADNDLTKTRQSLKAQCEGKVYYIKNIKYGNQRANDEVLSAKLMALTGLPTPKTSLVRHVERLFPESMQQRHDYNAHPDMVYYGVASEWNSNFTDLGVFLLTRGRAHVLLDTPDQEAAYMELVKQYREVEQAEQTERQTASPQLQALLSSQPSDASLTDDERQAIEPLREIKAKQLDCLNRMFEMLPQHLQYEIHVAYFGSQWIHNWDFLNFSMYNSGFCLRDTESPLGFKRTEWVGMVVDFGNSGQAGFKGKSKQDSLQDASRRARIEDPLPSQAFLRPADVQLSGSSLMSRTSLGGYPRSGPFAAIVAPMVEAETDMVGNSARVGGGRLPSSLLAGVEMAYRLSRVTDEDITTAIDRYCVVGQYGPVTIDELSSIKQAYISRRDRMIKQYTPEQIRQWRSEHFTRALFVDEQLARRAL